MDTENGSEIIDNFYSYLRNELNRSKLTSEAYCRDLRQFAGWITGDNIRSFNPSDVTTQDIRSWLASASATGDNPVTLRRKTQSLRSFYRFLMLTGVCAYNPASDVILAKKPRRLPAFVKETEMEEILSQPAVDFKGIRDHLILNLLYSCGIRQAELLALKDNDINFHSGEAVISGKGNKQRVIPFPAPLLQEISEWRVLRNSHYNIDPDGETYLFSTDKGNISKATVYNIVKRHLMGVAADRKSPHILRHTFATAMLNDGASLDTVKEMLGHSSMASTQLYTHVSFAQLKRNYDSSHPRVRKKNNGKKDDFS